MHWLLARAGIDAGIYREACLRRRLAACLRVCRAPSLEVAKDLVQSRPELLDKAVAALLIGVTSFFRGRDVCTTVEREIPRLLRECGRVRALSLGCSSGAELYSLAMLVAEVGGPQRYVGLGVDCRTDAIEQARQGVYAPSSVESVPPHLLTRYFTFESGRYVIQPELRIRTDWHTGSLFDERGKCGQWDVVLCRNVVMYLTTEAAQLAWQRASRQVRPGGLLIVGQAERPSDHLGLVPVGSGVYRRL